VEKVRAKRSGVRDKIELAKGNGMVATDKAKTWLSRADTIVSDGTDICDSEPTKVNWDISIATAKLRELRECLNDRPSDIVQPPSVMHIPVHDVLQPSQECFVELARQHIIDDPEGMTAIWGPVGVGKTLLLKTINNSFETENPLTPSSSNRGEPPFDFVIFLKATEECSVGNIQSEIMQQLKMQDNGDSLITRATRIYKFLQDKSFLVLLDGLETYLDLAAVGLPPLGIQGKLKKKVVVTTRSQSLCAEMRASRVMNVSGLDRDEALQLFQQKVGCENLYSNPRIGKHAEDIVDVLRARPSELIKFGMELRTIGDPKQWEDVILNKKEYWQQPSRATVFEQAMEYIKHEPVDVIGISGMGGVGKTHLLEKIQNQANSLFDHVISVTASRECSVERIQGQIVKNHKLEKADGEKNQAEIISRFLKGKSFVLLLDDLWDYIDLKAVGIPVRHPSEGQQKRKVVITTRDRKVCGQMDVRKEISVACLPDGEAWQLFQDKVQLGTLSSSPRIEALAKELVKELKGLPLALILTGRAMWGKGDPEQWEHAIGYMKKSCCDENDPISMETVFET
jgi:GTPase SAR1 family protein